MLSTGLLEFWSLNDTLTGEVGSRILVSDDGLDSFITPGKIGAGWLFFEPDLSSPHTLRGDFVFPVAAEPWTISLWYKRADIVRNQTGSLCHLLTAGSVSVIAVNDVVGTLARSFRLRVNAVDRITKAVAKDSLWHHIVATHDGASGYSLWVDGVKTTATAATPTGAVATVIFSNLSAVNGLGDSFGFWTRQLSDAEVADVYNAGNGWEYTPVADLTPDAFTFGDQTGAARNVQVQSDVETVTGMDAGTAISITGGEYSLDGGAYTSAAGTINPGQTLRLRLTTSADYDTPVAATVTVGTYSTAWTVRTGLPSFQPLLLARAV